MPTANPAFVFYCVIPAEAGNQANLFVLILCYILFMKKEFSENEIPEIASEILRSLEANHYKLQACVLALSGDLGAGKTTLTKEIAKQLGILETVISPTYVIMKSYPLEANNYKLLIHIDAYRLESDDELARLGWSDLIADPKNLIIIEWPEKVKNLIPNGAITIELSHNNGDTRTVSTQ